MGANLVQGGGATFRVWAPRAQAVYVDGVFGGVEQSGQKDELLLARDAAGYWAGFLPQAAEADTYGFFVVGEGSSGYKRDPYARELANDAALPFPVCRAVIRGAETYPWHDAGFRAPEFSEMVVYQLHIGTYAPAGPGVAGTYLDIVEKIPHLVALGANVLQPLPVYEMEDSPSQGYPGLGYQGADLFSPALDYACYDDAELQRYLGSVNGLLAAKGFPLLSLEQLRPGYAQLKAMVDLLHVYGIAVMFDVVYNHAGGWGATYRVPQAVDASGVLHGDDCSLYFWDRVDPADPNGGWDNNQSLYFTDQGFVGGLAFAMWNQDVRGFLRNNALWHVRELHADGFRFDEISMVLELNRTTGWDFCRELTGAVRRENPRVLQNAEYWPNEFGAPAPLIVQETDAGGLGFDAVQHDGLREAVRAAVEQAAAGADAQVGMTGIAMAVWPTGFGQTWRTIPCIENHDIVKLGELPRVPRLADGSNARSWYARSRTRVAMGLLLTAPGIPQLFMGQEMLEDKQWCPDPACQQQLVWWGGLVANPQGRAVDPAMADHLRFTQELIALRRRLPGLRGEGLNVFYTHDADRVIAFHRWVEGAGRDVVIAATLSEQTWSGYRIGFPLGGRWAEVFNSDAYDSCAANGVQVNPEVAGNGGGVSADGPGMHGLGYSAQIVIPASGVVVFARSG